MASIPAPTISRLVTYLRILTHLEDDGVRKTSSEQLAEEAKVSPFQVRKDLSHFGRFGTRGAGYNVPALRRELRRILGLTRPYGVAIVGMGRLGQALADYPNFNDYAFDLRAFFDVDPTKVGTTIRGIEIAHTDELAKVIPAEEIELAFITVPHEAAQKVADQLVAAGIKGILNFSPTMVRTPPEVHVEIVDFLAGLKRLAFHLQFPELEAELA